MMEFFLKRSAFTNLCTLVLIGMGIYQFATVKRELFPEVRTNMVTVTTVHPGAAPAEVEKLITNPVEDAIRGIAKIDRVESWSKTSLSQVLIRLDEDTDEREADRAITDIQQAVSRIQDLPVEVERPVVKEFSIDSPLISLCVVGGTPQGRDEIAEELGDAIEDLPEVSRVVRDGQADQEIWVEADPEKLAARELSLGELSRVIADENVDITAGTVDAGSREIVVRTLGGLVTAEDVGNIILKGNDERGFVRIGDVATVSEAFEDENYIVRVDGTPAVILRVMKREEADAIDLTANVRALKERFAPQLAKMGVTLKETDDMSFFIKRRLKVMKNNMMMGALLIVGAMLLFLNWRLAIVTSLGVGVAIASTFAFGVPMGMSLNALAIMAFIVVLGMLNDDAIVVTDNIFRHLQMGKSRAQAALDGTREVIKPVLGAVLTSCVAFMPFAMMTGIMGEVMVVFPVVITLCLVTSLLEAFFILPSHVVDISRLGRTGMKNDSRRWFDMVTEQYRRALEWSLDNRKAFFGIVAAAVVVTIALGVWRVKVVMFPSGLIDIFVVQVEMPSGTRIEETDAVLRTVEKEVLRRTGDDLDVLIATVGQTGVNWEAVRGPHLGQLQVNLRPQEDRPKLTSDIIEEIRRNVGELPGVRRLTFDAVKPGPPVGPAFMARIRGAKPNLLAEIADRFTAELRDLPGVQDIRDSRDEGKEELVVTADAGNLAYAGVRISAVSRELLSAYHGIEATKIRRGGDEVAVRVKLVPEAQGRESIDRLLVANPRGRQVPLGQLVHLKSGRGKSVIEHYDFRRVVTVTAGVDDVKATSFSVNRHMRKAFSGVSEDNPGVDVIFGGEEAESQKSFQSLGRAFVVAMLLNLAILMAIFESGSQPFLILLTVPIGIMGALLALVVHGKPISIMALLGGVAMSGVVVNNSIVLLDFTNRLREKGMAVRKALVEAGAVRLRPIFTSSATTLLCLFPTAYGLGGKEPFVQPLALTMAWGLAFATPLTLFVIPIAYSLMEDAGVYVRGVLGIGRGREAGEKVRRVAPRLTEARGNAYSPDA